MMKNFSFLLILFSTIFNYSFAQNTPVEALTKFSEEFPQEKIHILLNKKSFVVGESIYFKCFVIDGFQPSKISTSLFVELYDGNKKMILSKTLPIFLGEAFGNILLDENLKESVYYMRVYTTWSTNFSEKFQEIKAIPIYNPNSSEKLVLDETASWNVTIHPEGGTLLTSVPGKIAVRMHSKGKLPEKWTGYVIDEKNPTAKIAEFQSWDENVASFAMTPQFGVNYELIVKDNDGIAKTFPFPVLNNAGISLEVDSKNGMITYSPKFNQLPKQSAFYTILGQINNRFVYKAVVSKLIPDATYKIPTETLVNGILQLVILDDQNQVVAERLSFVDPQNLVYGKINLNNSMLNAAPKSLNVVNLPTKKQFTNFTTLVSDANAESTEDDNSLLSTMWLTGDIRSEISSPSQYFLSSSNPSTLDALLITEKWERFNWKQILAGQFPKISNVPADYITYTGKAMLNGAPAKNRVLGLVFSFKNSGKKTHQVRTDDEGIFIMSNMIFDEPFDMMYDLNDKEQKNINEKVTVIFQPFMKPTILKSSLPSNPYILTSNYEKIEQPKQVQRAIQDIVFTKKYGEKIALIEEVIIKRKLKDLKEQLNKKLSSPSFRSMNEITFDFVNEASPNNRDVFSFLDSSIAGLTIQRNGNNTVATMRGGPVQFYINEFLSDARAVEIINIKDVAMIKVIKPPFQGTQNGAIIIYVRNGATESPSAWKAGDRLPSMGFKNLKGYDKNDSFPIVDYLVTSKETALQDNRLTLYWNPNIQSTKIENGAINFFNNDTATAFKMTIFGYDEEKEQFIYLHQVVTP